MSPMIPLFFNFPDRAREITRVHRPDFNDFARSIPGVLRLHDAVRPTFMNVRVAYKPQSSTRWAVFAKTAAVPHCGDGEIRARHVFFNGGVESLTRGTASDPRPGGDLRFEPEMSAYEVDEAVKHIESGDTTSDFKPRTRTWWAHRHTGRRSRQLRPWMNAWARGESHRRWAAR